MELIVKHFSQLTRDELFELYKLRVAVFIVEQQCAYPEVDDADKNAYHLWLASEEGIRAAQEKFGAQAITIEAQTYARGLYEKAGFVQSSEEFLEDGIPHIQMVWRKP